MFVIKQDDGTFLTVKSDSHGYTVDWVTQDEAGATKFNTRREALDVYNELDEYWREESYITTVEASPF